jgi:hypothetical protein
MRELETHHGSLVGNELIFPEGFVLAVIGLRLEPEVTDALWECDFKSFIETSEGLEACK